VRKLLDQAKLSNYSLYKIYRQLKKGTNSDVLFTLLQQDSSNDPETTEILEIIGGFLANPPK
jgi:hypothetical protein